MKIDVFINRIDAIKTIEECNELKNLCEREPGQSYVLFEFLYVRIWKKENELLEQIDSKDFIGRRAKDMVLCIWNQVVTLKQPYIHKDIDVNTKEWSNVPSNIIADIWKLGKDAKIPPSLRAHVLEALLKIKAADDIQRAALLQELINAHLEAADWFLSKEDNCFFVVRHCQALKLFKKNLSDCHIKRLVGLREGVSDPRIIVDLIDVEVAYLLQAHSTSQKSRFEELLSLIQNLFEEFSPYHGDSYIEKAEKLEEKLLRRLGLSIIDKAELSYRKAKMCEQWDKEDPFPNQQHLLNAAKHFSDANRKKEAEQALTSFRMRGKTPLEKVEVRMGIIGQGYPEFAAAQCLGKNITIEIALEKIANLFFQTAEKFENQRWSDSSQISIASKIAETNVYLGDRLVRSKTDPESSPKAVYLSTYTALQLTPLFENLKHSPQLMSELESFFESSGWIKEEDRSFLKTAVARYIAGDLISMTHVLIPRIENVLRQILRESDKNISALNKRKDGIKEKLLEALLDEAETVLPTGVTSLIRFILCREGEGFNLRNNLFHGLATTEDCTQGNADLCLQIAIAFVWFGSSVR